MSLPVEQIETLLEEMEEADPYQSAAIATKIRRLVDEAANGERDLAPATAESAESK